ncbi:MAG: GGDEF domain-containing protein [Lachnospiraceae bacterium]|nr:GGDEF domain-containing protein [Lachnospiraceae bacterium]
MANNKEQRFRKLKKSHLWLSLLFLILFTLIAHAALVLFVASFLNNLLGQKIQGEYDHVSYMARLYENGLLDSDSRVLQLLDDHSSYLILNADEEIIEESGENTCDLTPEFIRISGVTGLITYYPDRDGDFLSPTAGGYLAVNFRKTYHFLTKNDNLILEQLQEGQNHANLPFWIEVPMKDGKSFVGKASFKIYLRDVILLSAFAALLAIMIFVIFVIMIISICTNRSHQRKLLSVFFTDEVTGQHNWMWILIRGEQMLKRRGNASKHYAILSILFMDYRNFCVCHSIAEGEAMLCKVDRTIAGILRRKEMSAHCSSASFAVLLQYNNINELKQRVEDLLAKLENIDETHKFAFHIGVDLMEPVVDASGKIVRRKTVNIEEEYNNACAARESLPDNEGSGIAFFDEALVEEQRWIDTVRERQDAALANEEFLVYYQPKYDPKTNELRGAEALVRWNSPEFGLIPPGRFIPIFEKSGFIPQIDHYMIEHVARDQKAWLDSGYKCVPVSVNVSRAHFIESDLAEQIKGIIDSIGTPHELIELEVTESAFFDDKKAMIDTINRLKSYGFTVSMDDFGSGYSSLNSLKDMPLDVLKLDAEFFRGDEGNNRGQIVVSEAVRLAKSLNMRTVAEGVEIKEQVDFLADLGCDMIQGYYFAKPMPKNEYESRMQNNNINNNTELEEKE